MPDTELFKLIVNGGSFAMLIMIGCWALFRLEPRIREMLEKKDESHKSLMTTTVTTFGEATQKIVSECAAAMRQQTEAHAVAMEKQSSENRLLIESLIKRQSEQADERAKECRDERKEWMNVLRQEGEANRVAIAKEGDLNRKARHDLANQVQNMLAEIYNNRRDEEGTTE